MKKFVVLFVVILGIGAALIFFFQLKSSQDLEMGNSNGESGENVKQDQTTASLANPAAQYCLDNEGKLEIVTNTDGSQWGMCQFEDYACEEWAYFRGECTVEEDAEKIKEALINKGLNLAEMKVVIQKHLGKYIVGGVVPVSAPAGGGYVFAVKDGDSMKIVADGNGVIMCEMLNDYPDFPTYLIPECVGETGNSITR
jgi:putative hemolysin